MTPQQFEEVTKGQAETFPTATAISKVKRLTEEVAELQQPEQNGECLRLEIADCFILLFGAASAAGLTYSDICLALLLRPLRLLGTLLIAPNERRKTERSRQKCPPIHGSATQHTYKKQDMKKNVFGLGEGGEFNHKSLIER